MIHKHVRRFCCEDISKIENYDLAISDETKSWCCHHKLETHTSDGERRVADISVKELKSLDMYYGRPASELIFLTRSEHTSLHNHSKKGKPRSEEAKRKISNKLKGRQFSEETKRKISEAGKGNKNAIGNHNMNKKHWKLVDGKRVWY